MKHFCSRPLEMATATNALRATIVAVHTQEPRPFTHLTGYVYVVKARAGDRLFLMNTFYRRPDTPL